MKKVLFAVRSPDLFIYYRSVIEGLLARGYFVRFLYDPKWTEKPDSLNRLEEFKIKSANFEYRGAVLRRDGWRKLLFHTRELLSFRSYLVPPRNELRKFYMERWKSYLPKFLQRVFGKSFFRFLLSTKAAYFLLRAFESIAPADKKILEDIKSFVPDVLIASPVNMRFSSADLEYLKAAKRLKIPTAAFVISWDNLTNKGLFHVFPDSLLVWSEEGKKEAVLHHHIPENSIKIIGAPLFDQWFTELQPSQTREEFCKKNGLRASDPIILYLGSSANIARDESWVIEELRKSLDESRDDNLRRAQIIIRPHPANKKIYERLNLHSTVVLPKEGSLPNSKEALDLFKDTLYYSICDIGINTSGMIDAIISNKPGLAFMPEQYKESQMETEHFKHLFNSGAITGVKDGGEFIVEIKKLLAGKDGSKEKRTDFIKNFIRPNGLEISAGECGAEEIEKIIKK